MTEHVVQQGECIESIAFEYGLFWETIWKHASNSGLRRSRASPNVLQRGDRVFVPERTPKTLTGATEKRHRFRRRGVPSKLKVILQDEEGKALANLPCRVEIDGAVQQCRTDGDGLVEVAISPGAHEASLFITRGGEEQVHELRLGHLDPADTPAGARHRLENLGIPAGESDEALGTALRRFQKRQGLSESGKLDDSTVAALSKAHGS